MSFAGFIFFSTLEYLALFYMVLILFRFEIRGNFLKFAIFAVVLSLVSNTLQIESLRTLSPLIHIALYILFVMLILKVNLFNASVMMITGQVIYMMIQWIIIVSVLQLGIISTVVPYTLNAFIIQMATAFIMYFVGFITNVQKGGFSFIDHNSRIKRTSMFISENRLFIFFLIFAVITTFFANLLFVIERKPPLLLITLLMAFSLVGILYTCMRTDDRANDGEAGIKNRQYY